MTDHRVTRVHAKVIANYPTQHRVTRVHAKVIANYPSTLRVTQQFAVYGMSVDSAVFLNSLVNSSSFGTPDFGGVNAIGPTSLVNTNTFGTAKVGPNFSPNSLVNSNLFEAPDFYKGDGTTATMKGFKSTAPINSLSRSRFGKFWIYAAAPTPLSHVQETQGLYGEGYVDLFEIHLAGGVGSLYLKNNEDKTWQGHLYEGIAIKLDGVETSSDVKDSKATLTIVNWNGYFSAIVAAGTLEKARVIRRRLLKTHLDANANIHRSRTWYVSRVAKLVSSAIVLELNEMTEGPDFLVPARMFIPPAFPVVNLE